MSNTYRIELRAKGVHVTMPYEADTMADAVHRSVGVAKAHESVHPGVEWTYVGVTLDEPKEAVSKPRHR